MSKILVETCNKIYTRELKYVDTVFFNTQCVKLDFRFAYLFSSRKHIAMHESNTK